jgi:MFS family permease
LSSNLFKNFFNSKNKVKNCKKMEKEGMKNQKPRSIIIKLFLAGVDQVVKKIHYSWFVCIGCILMMIVCSGMIVAGFTAFMPYITSENGFTNTQVNLITTIRTTVSFFAKMLTVALIHKIGVRRTAVFSCGLVTVAYICFAFAQNLMGYYFAGVLAGLANGFGGMIPVTIILNRWFKMRLHFALGLSAAGSATAVTVFTPIVTAIADHYGLQAAFLFAVAVCFVVTILVSSLIRNDPEEKGMQPYSGGEHTGPREKKVRVRSEGVAFSQIELWTLCIAPFLTGAVVLTAAPIYTMHCQGLGFDSMTAAMATSVYGVSLLIGKVLYGAVTEVIGGKKTNLAFLLSAAVGLGLSCMSSSSVSLLFVSSVLIGVGFTLATVGISAWAADLIRPIEFDHILGRFQIAYSLGGLLFSLAPGPLADHFGSYMPVFLIYAVMEVVALVVIYWAYQKLSKTMAESKSED